MLLNHLIVLIKVLYQVKDKLTSILICKICLQTLIQTTMIRSVIQILLWGQKKQGPSNNLLHNSNKGQFLSKINHLF